MSRSFLFRHKIVGYYFASRRLTLEMQVKECESRVEGTRRGVEQKIRDVEKEVERAEQQHGNDSQHLRDEMRSMREAYVRRLDVIDERVSDARSEVSRSASEAVHRDQQIDQKLR